MTEPGPRSRLLFVDDERAILTGLRHVFHARRNQWDMRFACGGREALELLAAEPADVVVTDMRMPDVDGLELLRAVQEGWPLAARIVLSGYADLAVVAQASSVAHQYLLKPCAPDVLAGVVERAIELQRVLASETLRRVVGGMGSLPARPRIYHELSVALADPEAELARLGRIVESDVAIAGRVLHFVNSAYYGLTRKVSSIEEAIVFIGVNTLRNLALTLEVFRAFGDGAGNPGRLEAEEEHALLTARIARGIVDEPTRADSAFAAGLLHDSGKLVLLDRLPDAAREIEARAERDRCPIEAAERAILGADHAEVGAYVLGLWGMPHAIVEPVAFHHSHERLTRGGLDAVVAVGAANLLARAVARTGRVEPGAPQAATLDGLASGRQAAWRERAEREAAVLRGEAGGAS